VQTDAGRSYTCELLAGVGLMTDQSPVLYFGLGEATTVRRVVITPPGHEPIIIDCSAINRVLTVPLTAQGDFGV